MNTKVNPRKVFVVVGIAAAVYVILVVALYVGALGSLPFSRSDPGAWGQFGDYIGGLLNPLFAVLNVVVVAYIAISVQKWNDSEKKREEESQERVKTAIDLHREWNNESNYRSRTIAGVVVRKFPSSTMLEIEESTKTDEAVHVWIVIGFFLRLSFLVQHEKVHREMAIELFGELFVWWWVVSFEKQLVPVDWDAREPILSLKEWFYAATTEERRAPWIRRAQRDLAQAIEQSKNPPFFVL